MERLKTLAKRIESLFPDLVTELDSWTSCTDRHPRGVRWRIPGKGRKGTRLRVFLRRGPGLGPADYFSPIFEHRAGDTYRSNRDVLEWIEREARLKLADLSAPPSEPTTRTQARIRVTAKRRIRTFLNELQKGGDHE